MFCKNCGKEINEGTKFCPNCGQECSAMADVTKAANDMFNATEKQIASAVDEVRQSFNGENGNITPNGREKLKDDRGLAAFIILSFVTCGIYACYWYYKLGNRLAANASYYGMNFQENGTTVLMWFIFGMLLCGIGPFIGMHILIKNSNKLCNAYNRKYGLN